ncbi:hypothetical protein ACIQCR_26895 [Streptomyces sp. NPDC093249]
MGWGTGKGSSSGDGKHSGDRDPGTAAPSPDTAKPKDPPKHKKEEK